MRIFALELKELSEKLDLQDYFSYLKNLGIGSTPLRRLPKEANPYDDTVPICVKEEYLNFGGSVKSRPFATMHYFYERSGEVDEIEFIVAPTSGNFGRSASYILKDSKQKFVPYMAQKTRIENPEMIEEIEGNGIVIKFFQDEEFCPISNRKRGKAIAFAELVERENPKFKNYNQYEDSYNPLSYYLTLAQEIYEQTDGMVTHYVAALGTGGSFLGTARSLLNLNPNIHLVDLIPQEEHHQLGIRSRSELGEAEFPKKAQEIAEKTLEVSDIDAYNSMIKLWENGIPAGITTGTNVYGALQAAKELHKRGEEGLIVTLAPDSLEPYKTFLEKHMKKIAGKDFEKYSELYEELKQETIRRREEHIKKLKQN